MTDATSTPSGIEPIEEPIFELPNREVTISDQIEGEVVDSVSYDIAPIEIESKRTYNAKHFNNNGQIEIHAHVGHIHYKDGEEFKDIDWTLIFDEKKKGWGFDTHSYKPFIPEYSDGWLEFNDRYHFKNQTVKYKPITENVVKGVLIDDDPDNPNFDNNPDNKAVLYKNAFGDDKDFIVYNTRSSLVKVATVNNPNVQKSDVVFEWEIELPDKEVFRVDKPIDAEDMTKKGTETNTENGKLVGYRLRKEKAKNFNTKKQTLIGNSQLDGNEWFTYLRGFKAWDSEGNTIDIEARIEFEDGKTILRKIIPLEFLQSAIGKVYTDTTTSYYSGEGDGRVQHYGATSWANSYNGVGGSYNIADTLKSDSTGIYNNRYLWRCIRSFYPINTAGIGDTSTLVSASFNYYGYRSSAAIEYEAHLVEQNQASVTSLTSADFTTVERTVSGGSAIIDSVDEDTWVSLSIDLNSTALGWINKSGYSKLGLIGYYDYTGITVPQENAHRCGANYSEDTVNDAPYLSVTYTEQSPVLEDANFFGCNF